MKTHPIGLYLLCVILVKFCKAQNGYHYNRPTGRPFLPTSNNHIPNSDQKLSGIYQPQGSQKSYQNELSTSGYQYNRPSSQYTTTPSPLSQTVGFPQPFRPNNGATSPALYSTTARPFSGNTNPTTFRGTLGAEFSGTTFNPFTSGETPEDKITAITSSPLNSRGSLGAGTSTTTSSPFNIYNTSPVSSNENFDYQTSTFLTLNQDYGNAQRESNNNAIPNIGLDYGSNTQFGNSPNIQRPSVFGIENSRNTAPGSQLGSQTYNNFNSNKAGNLGTNSDNGGNVATSNPFRGKETPAGSFDQKPGISNTNNHPENGVSRLDPNNIYYNNRGSPDTAGSNAGNTDISISNEQYNENLIPQGTSNFGPGTIDNYGSNVQAGGSQTQRPNSFNVGNTGAPGFNNAYKANSVSQGPNDFNEGETINREPSTGYGVSSAFTGSSRESTSNSGSSNDFERLASNQGSGNFNVVNLGNARPSNGYGNNFGAQEANSVVVGSSTTHRPTTLSSGNDADQYQSNIFNGNLGQKESNNAIEGNYGPPSSVFTSTGNQGSQNLINAQESGITISELSNIFGGNKGLQGFDGTNPGNLGNVGPNFSATTRFQRPDDDGSAQNGNYSAIPGTPNLDYPILSEIPPTKFSCDSQKYPGYYADIDARCQVFHICINGLKYDFLCPNGTVFHQKYFVCVWWNQFECNSAESLYNLNKDLYDYDKMGSLIENAAGITGAQGPTVTYAPGFNPQGPSSNFNPPTGPPESAINFTPSSNVEGSSTDYGVASQTTNPSFNSEALAGQQELPTSTISSFHGYNGLSPNYGSSNQQQGSKIPQSTFSGFESSAGPPSSPSGFTPFSSYERPSNNYDNLGPFQSQSSNLGYLGGQPGQSINYGASNNPQESSNNYEQSSSPGGISSSGSPSNAQGSQSSFGSSPDLQGSSANYPGYQELRPSADAGSFSSTQSPSVTHDSFYAPQNSVTNSGSSIQPQGITNKVGPLSPPQKSINQPSREFQSYPNSLGISNSPPNLSNNLRLSSGSQPGADLNPIYSSPGGYENSGNFPESSANFRQIGGPRGFTPANSPLTSPQESTKGYNLPSVPQHFLGNANSLGGISNSSNNYPQFSGFPKPSFDFEPPSNSQKQSANYKPLSNQYPGYQSLSGLQISAPNSGTSFNSLGASANLAVPRSSSHLSTNFSPSTIPRESYANLGQQSSLQKPSPSYGPPSGPSSNFGQQQYSVYDSPVNSQIPSLGESSTPSSAGQASFRQPSASQITSASFSPLSNQPSSNYGASTYMSGPTFTSSFGGSQGSSPAPFTLAGASQKLPIHDSPQSPAFSTPRPPLNYNPSGINRQQYDFRIPASRYSGNLNNEQGPNYPTTVGLDYPVNTYNTEQPSNHTYSNFSSTAVTSPQTFNSPFSASSTALPESYSTESNVLSNTFSIPELSYPGYDRETTRHNNNPFSSSNQQVTKPNREYLPPFRKR